MRPVKIDPTGESGPTRRQTRGRAWRRSSRGLYVPADVDASDPQQRVLEAATAVPEGYITGWATFAWSGARWFDGFDHTGQLLPVPIVVHENRRATQAGYVITQERLSPRHDRELDGILGTDPTRSIAFEARYATDLADAVVALDMAMATDLVSIREVAAYTRSLNGWTGVPQLREALLHAVENSWSPMETEMRLIWVSELGIHRIVCNHPVFDLAGNHVGTPDLLDVEAGVVGEYDGALHLVGRQRAHDIKREADFRRLGLEYVTMTAADRRDPSNFVRRTQDARQRALLAQGARAWTIEPPAWWTPTTTVEQRRALSTDQRVRFLRRRSA
ncbi:hypothetical protein GCM10010197_15260 [Nocardioides luteus]|uniref:DUF559 domain-containing protein n=2 Tax=Nocardioides luteus TaxID=1844 RepID=A0ABQ5SUE3_9ACTN|nr:hypothetical protein GCM10010197_15260 [Nocardioides luteus]GLJ67451.1 hypothetical protein GCM10017579_14870 [Nocardioides luteus]